MFNQISKSINKIRYSTSVNPIIPPSMSSIDALFQVKPPFDPEKSYAEEVSRVGVQNRLLVKSVYLYDKDQLVPESPFTSYADVHRYLGLDPVSRLVYRKLDTGKLYLNRYSFTSKPKLC